MSTTLPEPRTSVLAGTIWDELAAGLSVGVLLHDGSGAVLAANPRAAELLGIPSTDLLHGLRPEGWQACDESGAPLPEIAELSVRITRAGMPATGPFVVTVRGVPYRRLWGEVYPVQLRGEAAMVTVLHSVQEVLRRCKGLLDPLTGLPNRTLLFDRLEQALIRAHTHGSMASVILADVRGLRAINVKHGFPQGDRLIAVLARRLRQELRADHTVARYAGGTLAVLADHPHGTGEPIVERIGTIARRRVVLGDVVLHPCIRTGWATSDGSATVHELIRQAESRLRTT
jgi:diguanylate cyclase (GGDEF)-like protein